MSSLETRERVMSRKPSGRPLEAQSPPAAYVPGQLIMRIDEDAVSNVPDLTVLSTRDLEAVRMPETVEEPLADLRRRHQITDIQPVFSRTRTSARLVTEQIGRKLPRAASFAAALAASVRDSESEFLRGINVLHLAKSADESKIASDLSKARGVEYCHRVPARWLLNGPAPKKADPLVNRQWALRATRWFDADREDAGLVKVAVLDTGIDASHPDLSSTLTFYDHDGQSERDIVGHGTHVAGIIAAATDNDLGIAGVASCDLSAWKIFPDEPAPDGNYYVNYVVYQRALNACRTGGIRVVNLSIGGTATEQTEVLVFRALIDTGALVVAAMGNEYEKGNPVEYPAAHDDVLAVGATNQADRRAWFSNTGAHIGIAAPGMGIVSTLPTTQSIMGDGGTEYGPADGTSMAAPHVAGAAALVLAKHPGWDGARVAEQLRTTATKVPQMDGRTTTHSHGAGLLNIADALS